MKWPVLFLASCLAACGDLPRDQGDTLRHIAETGVVRLGVIAGSTASPHAAGLQALAERAAGAAGARVQRVEAAAEPLLLKLEAGELDLVAGEFDSSSPWVRRVHLLPPLASEQRGEAEVEATVAARNGENGWIMLLEREARAVAGGGR